MTRPHRRRVLIDPTDEHGGPYRVRFRFDRELIEYLKAIIDKTERRYDPATRTWFVASWWLDAVIEEFCACGYDVWVDGQAWPTHRDDPRAPAARRRHAERRNVFRAIDPVERVPTVHRPVVPSGTFRHARRHSPSSAQVSVRIPPH